MNTWVSLNLESLVLKEAELVDSRLWLDLKPPLLWLLISRYKGTTKGCWAFDSFAQFYFAQYESDIVTKGLEKVSRKLKIISLRKLDQKKFPPTVCKSWIKQIFSQYIFKVF